MHYARIKVNYFVSCKFLKLNFNNVYIMRSNEYCFPIQKLLIIFPQYFETLVLA